MTQCKAITDKGTQCEREARDGCEYCAIPKHAEQEIVVEGVPAVIRGELPQYGIAILAVGAKSMPEIGGFSGIDTQRILQDYYDRGYDLFSVSGGNLIKIDSSMPEYMSLVYTFKLRE